MAIIRTAQFGQGTMDMEFLGLSMERQPQILPELIVSRWAHLPLQSLLSGVYGDSPSEEMLPSNMVRWKVMGIPQKPVYVISATGPFRVGSDSPSFITVSDSLLQPGAKVRLEDGQTLLYIKGNRSASGSGVTHEVEVVGNNVNDGVDMTYLEKGRALNYVTANYEEGSETGHPIQWGTGDHYVQALTIHRHKYAITGDALTEALTMEMIKTAPNGDKKIFKGYLPNVMMDSGQTLLDFHMDAIEKDLVYGRANFDPSTGQIFNHAANGRPVLMGDGLKAQLESAYTVVYSPNDAIGSIRAGLERMLAFLSYNTGQDLIDLICIGGTGARMIWNLAMRDFLIANGQHTVLNADKSPVTIAGLDVDTFKTSFGSIKFVTSQAFNNPLVRTREVTVNGLKLPAESFDMYAFPVKKMSNGKNNIRTFAKAKQAGGKMVNRSLVFGHIPGMSGLSTKQQGELAQYGATVSTGRDAEQFEVLSQKGLIVSNPAECARMLVAR